MTKGDYELIALGTTGARLESMIKGETFAGVLNPPFDGKALDAGMRRIGDQKKSCRTIPTPCSRWGVSGGRKIAMQCLASCALG